MYSITQFRASDRHPFGMLAHFESYGNESESLLCYFLNQCVESGSWITIQLNHEQPRMVSRGLLEDLGERKYRLTDAAKALLLRYFPAP